VPPHARRRRPTAPPKEPTRRRPGDPETWRTGNLANWRGARRRPASRIPGFQFPSPPRWPAPGRRDGGGVRPAPWRHARDPGRPRVARTAGGHGGPHRLPPARRPGPRGSAPFQGQRIAWRARSRVRSRRAAVINHGNACCSRRASVPGPGSALILTLSGDVSAQLFAAADGIVRLQASRRLDERPIVGYRAWSARLDPRRRDLIRGSPRQ